MSLIGRAEIDRLAEATSAAVKSLSAAVTMLLRDVAALHDTVRLQEQRINALETPVTTQAFIGEPFGNPLVLCPHNKVTVPMYDGGNDGTQKCLDCGAERDDYTEWRMP